MMIFLASKIQRILQNVHLRRCASNHTAQRMSIIVTFRLYASRFGFLHALQMNVFEKLIKMEFFKNRTVVNIS